MNSETPQTKGAKPTLRSLAEVTGFSIATVSRALADDPRIAAKTRAKVAEAAERPGMFPTARRVVCERAGHWL